MATPLAKQHSPLEPLAWLTRHRGARTGGCCLVFGFVVASLYETSYQQALREARAERSIIHTGVRQRSPGERYCGTLSEAYPGKVYEHTADNNTLLWEPDAACKMKHFPREEAASCLRRSGKRIAFYGDSLLDDLGDYIGQKAGGMNVFYSPKETVRTKEDIWWTRHNRAMHLPLDVNATRHAADPFLEVYWSPSLFYSDPTERANASAAMGAADVVVLHNSMWDLGMSCQGLHAYYQALKGRILKARALMKPGALLLLYDLHWLWPNQCLLHKGQNSKCYKWNPTQRVRQYRRALRLAAACTGVRVASDTEVTKNLATHTWDGIHYNTRTAMYLKADVFLNGICDRDGQPPMEFPLVSKSQCDEISAFADWEESRLSRSCPSW